MITRRQGHSTKDIYIEENHETDSSSGFRANNDEQRNG